jgi:hypothetical protein
VSSRRALRRLTFGGDLPRAPLIENMLLVARRQQKLMESSQIAKGRYFSAGIDAGPGNHIPR